MTISSDSTGTWATSGTSATSSATDMRRRHGREAVERITARAQWLENTDRQLIMAVFEDGKRLKDLAALMNVSPRTLRARLRRLVLRVSSELYQFVALHAESWPPNMRRAAEACVFKGLSIKDAAIDLGVSYHNVRRHIDLVRVLARTGTLIQTASNDPLRRPTGFGRRTGSAAANTRSMPASPNSPRRHTEFDEGARGIASRDRVHERSCRFDDD